MKNEEALKKMGLDYSSFDEKELATIISKVMIESKGIAKNKYAKLINNLGKNSTDFIKKMVKYGRLSTKFSESLIEELMEIVELNKEKDLKEAEERKAKDLKDALEKRAELDKLIKELGGK